MHFHSKSVFLCLGILSLLSHGVSAGGLKLIPSGDNKEQLWVNSLKSPVKKSGGLVDVLFNMPDLMHFGKRSKEQLWVNSLKSPVKKSGGLVDVLFNMPDLMHFGKRSKYGDVRKPGTASQSRRIPAYFIKSKKPLPTDQNVREKYAHVTNDFMPNASP